MHTFFNGFISFFKGIRFSVSHLSIWFLIPLFLWFVLSILLSFQLSNWLITILYDLIKSYTYLDLSVQSSASGWKDILKISFQWSVIIIVKLFIWYLMGRFMKYLILILLSPLFAFISEKTEELVTGKKYKFKFLQFVKDVYRGILITCRNMLLESLLIFIGAIISFFAPVISPFVLIGLFLVNSYFMAFNFFDYIVERRGMNFSKRIQYMRINYLTLLGFGIAYNCISWIPFFNWVLVPLSAASGAVLADNNLPTGKSAATFL
jgi:CysZ protein